MPCRDRTHDHQWPQRGTLNICKCEIFCGYCTGEDAKKIHAHQWDLRAHVREMHARSQGLKVIVSPRPVHHDNQKMSSKKRKIAEVDEEASKSEAEDDNGDDDKKDDDENEDDDEAENSSSSEEVEEESEEDENVSPASKEQTSPNDTKNANKNIEAGPLRLRAKAVPKAKKAPLSSHAASFRPIGPKVGPPAPKRPRQEGVPVLAPPGGAQVPRMQANVAGRFPLPPQTQGNVSGGAQPNQIQVPHVAMSGHPTNFQAGRIPVQPYGQMPNQPHAQQVPNQPNAPTNAPMGPPPPSLSHPQAVRNPAHGYHYFRHSQPVNTEYWRQNPGAFSHHSPSAPVHPRLRSMTQQLLTTSTLGESALINFYETEAEFVRQMQMRRYVAEAYGQFHDLLLRETNRQAQMQFQANVPGFLQCINVEVRQQMLQMMQACAPGARPGQTVPVAVPFAAPVATPVTAPVPAPVAVAFAAPVAAPVAIPAPATSNISEQAASEHKDKDKENK